MLKFILILGAVAVAANVLFIWYAKRRRNNTKTDKSATLTEGPCVDSHDFLSSEEGRILKQSAAAELGVSVKELDRLSVEEIRDLAKINELIN